MPKSSDMNGASAETTKVDEARLSRPRMTLRMTPRAPVALALLSCMALNSSAVNAKPKTYVVTPAIEWDALVPYMRANLVARLKGNSFDVSVCPAEIDKADPKPFDESLSDFTCVLLTEAMHSDKGVEAAITSAMASFRKRVPELSADERNAFRQIFWDTLARSPYFLPKLEERFAKAREEKRLRCSLCEKNPGFAPKAPRTGKR